MNFPIFNHLKNDNLFQDKTLPDDLNSVDNFAVTCTDLTSLPTLKPIQGFKNFPTAHFKK